MRDRREGKKGRRSVGNERSTAAARARVCGVCEDDDRGRRCLRHTLAEKVTERERRRG